MSNEDRKLSSMHDQFSRLSTAFSKETKLREERDLRLVKQLKEALIYAKDLNCQIPSNEDHGDICLACEVQQILEAVVSELENK